MTNYEKQLKTMTPNYLAYLRMKTIDCMNCPSKCDCKVRHKPKNQFEAIDCVEIILKWLESEAENE